MPTAMRLPIHLSMQLLPEGRVRRLLAAVLLSGALAEAADPGVGVSVSSALQLATVRSLGTHWVRIFVSWRSLEPTPGGLSPGVLASFEQAFNRLPPGTKVIADVVGTPAWETGSSNEYTPPANPNDYA